MGREMSRLEDRVALRRRGSGKHAGGGPQQSVPAHKSSAATMQCTATAPAAVESIPPSAPALKAGAMLAAMWSFSPCRQRAQGLTQ